MLPPMALYEFEGKRPVVGEGSFVFPSADVIGDVVIGEGCFIGAGAVLRGDYGRIRIGDESSIQENVVMHAREGEETRIGKRVQCGHGSLYHTCTVENAAVIGVGAVVSDYAVVGEWAIVAEGAVVRTRMQVPPGRIVAGVPAKLLGEVTEEMKVLWEKYKDLYAHLARDRYPKGLKRID